MPTTDLDQGYLMHFSLGPHPAFDEDGGTADFAWFRCPECGGERWLADWREPVCDMPECREAEMERL